MARQEPYLLENEQSPTRRPPRWTVFFLRALEGTGNVRIAAEGAGVDFSTAYQRRKRHGGFAAAWAAALGAFAARKGEAEGSGAAAAPPQPDVGRQLVAVSGAGELVARPDGKLIKGSAARWGKRAESEFLLALTVHGSVRLAAKAAGFSTTAVYRRRLKERRFAAAWDAAVETGKARVQSYLVEAATRTFDPDELPIADAEAVPKVSISEAINIAKLKAPAPAASATGAGAFEPEEPVDEEQFSEIRARILEKLQRLRERNLCELGEAGWREHEVPVLRPGRSSVPEMVWLPPGYAITWVGDA